MLIIKSMSLAIIPLWGIVAKEALIKRKGKEWKARKHTNFNIFKHSFVH